MSERDQEPSQARIEEIDRRANLIYAEVDRMYPIPSDENITTREEAEAILRAIQKRKQYIERRFREEEVTALEMALIDPSERNEE